MKASAYNNSLVKRVFDLSFAFVVLILTSPLFVLVSLLIVVFSGLPIFFKQRRVGKGGKYFNIYKFRTMVVGAENLQRKFSNLNESDGPVFKISNDPRFTGFGKLLSKTGLDELPQFINIIKGDMSVVGPRPLPVYEANKLTKKDNLRTKIKPGITSTWVVGGSHRLSFKDWMRLDREYLQEASLTKDIAIVFSTIVLILNFLLKL